MSLAFVLFQLMLIAIGAVMAADQACYGLNGTKLDSTFGPCKTGSGHSGCCAINRPAGSVDICLDNGLCMATNGQYMGTIWQDGCTDPTGKDAGCPKMCPDARDNFDGLNKVMAWNVQMCDYGTYCCRAVNDRNNCCNNATAPVVKTNFIGAFQFETSTAGVASSTSAPTSTPTPASAAAETFVGTAVSSGLPIQATSTSAPESITECKKDQSAVVGGAVGGVLGTVIIALLGAICWLYKRETRQRKLKEHYEEQFGQTWAYRRTLIVESDSQERSELSTAHDEKGITSFT